MRLIASRDDKEEFRSYLFLMNYDEQRKYIHDMANSLSIVEASVSRVLTLLTRNHPQLADEISKLRKADEYSKKTIHALKNFREYIHNEIQKNEGQS